MNSFKNHRLGSCPHETPPQTSSSAAAYEQLIKRFKRSNVLNDSNLSTVSNLETPSFFFFLDKKEAKNQGCRKIG
jgi:hypothetical protein